MLELITILGVVLLHYLMLWIGFENIASAIFQIYSRIFTIDTSTVKLDKTKTEIIEIKEQILCTSAQDEFAKWAKLKRKFDKLVQDYERDSKQASQIRQSFESGIHWVLYGSIWGIQIVLLIYWSQRAVFYVPGNWFGPLTSWLKFPFAPNGIL